MIWACGGSQGVGFSPPSRLLTHSDLRGPPDPGSSTLWLGLARGPTSEGDRTFPECGQTAAVMRTPPRSLPAVPDPHPSGCSYRCPLRTTEPQSPRTPAPVGQTQPWWLGPREDAAETSANLPVNRCVHFPAHRSHLTPVSSVSLSQLSLHGEPRTGYLVLY